MVETWLRIIRTEMVVIQAIRAVETQGVLQIIAAIQNAQVTATPIIDQDIEVIQEVITMEVIIVLLHLQDPILQVQGVVLLVSEVVPQV